MKKRIITLLILFLILNSTYVVIGGKVGIKNETEDDFDARIEALMKHGHMPSLAACVVKNNTVVWAKPYGYADLRPLRRRKTTLDTVYPMGSISKSIAATAIMKLNETGLIGLDDNVSEYLPFDLKNPKHPDVNITFRMLMAHQSSIGDDFIKYSLLAKYLKNTYNWIGKFYKNPRAWNDHAPGKDVLYATQGINILGLIIEQVTNQSYVDYCQEHIFEPLQMKKTSFSFDNYDKDELACLYVWIAGIYIKGPYLKSPELTFPGGGLKSSISDLSHYLIMHTSGGVYNGVRILSEESVEEMHRAQYPDSYDDGIYLHGLGWYFKTSDYGETYGGHGGSIQGTRTEMKMRYSDKVGIIIFWNQNSYTRMYFGRVRPEEKEAWMEIERALFEKADEL